MIPSIPSLDALTWIQLITTLIRAIPPLREAIGMIVDDHPDARTVRTILSERGESAEVADELRRE